MSQRPNLINTSPVYQNPIHAIMPQDPVHADTYNRVCREIANNTHHVKLGLNDTRNDLNSTNDELRSTRTQLDDTRTELGDTRTQLDNTRNELNSTRTELGVTRTQLSSTQTDLSNTREDLEGQISALRGTTNSSLSGVNTAVGLVEGRLDSHIGATNNPHRVSFQQIFNPDRRGHGASNGADPVHVGAFTNIPRFGANGSVLAPTASANIYGWGMRIGPFLMYWGRAFAISAGGTRGRSIRFPIAIQEQTMSAFAQLPNRPEAHHVTIDSLQGFWGNGVTIWMNRGSLHPDTGVVWQAFGLAAE